MTHNPTAADITFRDLAALRAMQVFAEERDRNGHDWTDEAIAHMAYGLADAMVKERARRMETSEEPCDCVDDGCCDSASPDGHFVCTRPKGHEGPHVACGHPDHRLETWEDDQ